jgi:NNP family nitrate/nitrite transporter-like MFS transporter
VGTANAAAAGWGNAGGGATQTLMPIIATAIVSMGVSETMGWRYALVVPGVMMLIMASVYWNFTQDCPEGNYSDLRAQGIAIDGGKKGGISSFLAAAANYRVWLLFITYGACFGIEIFIHNIAALYYTEHFALSIKEAGLAVGAFGGLALFARALGGYISDRAAGKSSLNARVMVLFVMMVGEGLGLLWFAKSGSVVSAVFAMLVFGLFVHMACGATYAIVPFVDKKALGGVAGIIGAGGNVGAVAAGFLMKGTGDVQQTLTILAVLVLLSALCAIAVRLTAEEAPVPANAVA